MISEKEQADKEYNESNEKETNQRVIVGSIEVYPEELIPHPINTSLYDDDEVDEDLVLSIQEKGIIEPLIISIRKNGDIEEKIIISGHRRWRALMYINEKKLPRVEINLDGGICDSHKHIKRKAKCQIVEFKDEYDEIKAVIEYNKRRDKKYSRLYNEIEILRSIYEPDALANRMSNLLQNTDVINLSHRIDQEARNGKFDPQLIDETFTHSEKVKALGHLVVDTEEIATKSDKQASTRTRKRIHDLLGISEVNIDKITEIGRMAKAGDEVAKEAMKNLDKGKWKVYGAHQIVKIRKQAQSSNVRGRYYFNSLVEDAIKDKIKPKDAMEEFNKVAPMPQKTIVTRHRKSKTYSIILINQATSPEELEPIEKLGEETLNPTIEYLKTVDLPAADDSALFFVVNIETIKHSFFLMKLWGYKLQSFTIVESEHKGFGNWFRSGYDVLLFGIRGNWPMPAKENQFITGMIGNKEYIHDTIEYMYPDVKSLYELGVKEQRPTWGKTIESLQPKPEKTPEEEAQKIDAKSLMMRHITDDDDESSASPAAAAAKW